MIPGLMVIHIRRGDYLEHCRNLADRLEDFVSVNTFPGLPDPFPLPDRHGLPRGQAATAGPATAELYRARCFPSVDEIVAKVAAARASPAGRGVRRLYVMTNGDRAFVAALEAALWARAEWELVASSRDLVLDWEQTFVAQAVDQLVAQRAQVFIGNGVSDTGLCDRCKGTPLIVLPTVLDAHFGCCYDAPCEWAGPSEQSVLVIIVVRRRSLCQTTSHWQCTCTFLQSFCSIVCIFFYRAKCYATRTTNPGVTIVAPASQSSAIMCTAPPTSVQVISRTRFQSQRPVEESHSAHCNCTYLHRLFTALASGLNGGGAQELILVYYGHHLARFLWMSKDSLARDPERNTGSSRRAVVTLISGISTLVAF